MQHTTIAVDIAKSVFQVAVSDRPGRVTAQHRVSRGRFVQFFVARPPATVLLEACGSAHYWGRQLTSLGHTVRLLPPHDVHRYVRRNKTDATDAKALLEADRNEEIHPVPIKTVEQQALASLHRLRSAWQATRTARLNTLRGLLREFGVTIPVGARYVVPQVRALVEDTESPVPAALRSTLAVACEEIGELETAVLGVEQQLAALARQNSRETQSTCQSRSWSTPSMSSRVHLGRVGRTGSLPATKFSSCRRNATRIARSMCDSQRTLIHIHRAW